MVVALLKGGGEEIMPDKNSWPVRVIISLSLSLSPDDLSILAC